jgi:predicted secreted hydrolase
MQRRHFLIALAAWRCLLPSPAAAVDFAPVLPGRRLVFPDDFGAHPDFRTEWWYATGWLKRPDGQPLGFQITFFRVRTGIGESNASRFAPRQLMLAHAAIADPEYGRLRHSERTARVGFGHAGFTLGRSEVWIGDWRLTQQENSQGNRYQARVHGADFSYDLALDATAPPLLNGRDGFSSKAADPRHASYYYSRPQLAVSGSVSLQGRAEAVSGHAWLDHEWSSELLPDGAQGWDWVGINLADGSALMAFRLRDTSGNPQWAAGSLRSTGKIDQIFSPQAVNFSPLRRWRSPRTGVEYPVAWRLQIGQRVFELSPLLDDQELDSRRSVGTVYWEGAIRVSENGQPAGEGYLELAGYGEKIRIG